MICKFEAFKFFKFYNIEINTVLDIGAHKGKWTQTFKEHYPNVKALMIEANEDHIDDLNKNRSLYTCIELVKIMKK
jgi:FkbM family methyltransferase